MKKVLLCILFLLIMSAASMAAVGASSWATDGTKLAAENYLGGYGLADSIGGMYLFVPVPGGTLDFPTFLSKMLHIDKDGNNILDVSLDKSLPSGIGSRLAASDQFGKIAVMDPNNDPMVVWARVPNVSGTGTKEIYVQKFNSGGSYQWNNATVPILVDSTEAIGSIKSFCIETDTAGGAFVVYIADHKIYCVPVDSSGVAYTRILITDEGSSPITKVMTAKRDATSLWVVWTVQRGDSDHLGINAAGLALGIGPAGPRVKMLPIINSANKVLFAQSSEQSICDDGNGGFLVTWSDYNRDGGSKNKVYVQWVDSSATMYPASGLGGKVVFGAPAGEQKYPAIDRIDTKDHVIVVCQSTEGGSMNVYGSKVSIDPSLTIDWLKKLTTKGTSGFSNVCADGSGNAFISYLDGRNEPNAAKLYNWFSAIVNDQPTSDWTGNADIYARKISGTTGEDMWTQGDIPLCRALNVQDPKQIVNVEAGKAVSFWIDTRDSATNPSYIVGKTSREAQQLILAGSSVYGARIGDGLAPTVTVSKIGGMTYTSGMSIPQDILNTMEGTVLASGSTFSTNYSSIGISWDSGAVETVGFTPVNSSLSNFSHQKALANGTHSFVITAADDYGIPGSASGTVLASADAITLSSLQFAWGAKPTGYITISSINTSFFSSTFSILVQFSDGTEYLISSSNIKLEKMVSQYQGIYSFSMPVNKLAGTYTATITVKDNLNQTLSSIVKSGLVVSSTTPATLLASLQNGQLTLTVKTNDPNYAQTPITATIVMPGGSTINLNTGTAKVIDRTSTPGMITIKWDVNNTPLKNVGAKGIYPFFMMGEKTYLVIYQKD